MPEESVLAARQQFLQRGAIADALVPKSILRSWTRCAGLGLCMAGRPSVEPMAAKALKDLHEQHDLLRRWCRPELEALSIEAQAADGIVILTDASGLVLERLGSMNFADRAARVALSPGVSWREGATGTNAIGTAIAERRPIEVRGSEHYFELHRILSCSAAPIIDPRGQTIGVLDLSGPASAHPTHALGLVRFAVNQIEHRMFDEGFERSNVLRFHPNQAMLGTPREGIAVFDDHKLIAANRHGLDLLGLDADALGTCRFGDLFACGFTGLVERCQLRSHRGVSFFARLRRPVERIAPTAPPRLAVGMRACPAPWFDETTLAARDRAVRMLDADIPVLLQGETGAGKEIFARQVHACGARSTKAFVAINCAALPESLIESELFGYEEGAFTGARRHGHAGVLRQADGGVLFLDEIGDMPLALQARLLRVMQEREITPLGGTRAVAVDFAVICATHRNLRDLVATAAFRSDLYFRIAQYTVHLPSVRALSDRPALIRTLWKQLGSDDARITLAPQSEALLAAYDWPGNFRQLVGTLRALLALAEPGRPVTPDQLPPEIHIGPLPVVSHPTSVQSDGAEPCRTARLDEMTKHTMRQTLTSCGGNVSEAARRLGINRSTLYRRLLCEGA
jgi:transcriptional regulator of acetoin/glycerol metabolism